MLTKSNSQSEVNQFRIEEIGLDSSLLEAVIKLHSSRKDRLGPFPRGAFEDHARRKMILVAVAPTGDLAGYLLYRIAKSRAAIVHLTTSDECRNKGVARLLVDCLKARTRQLLGVSLRCRRDYNINDMWRSFGFTVRHSKEGRGADGALLDYWWFDHNHEDLFSRAAAHDDISNLMLTALDANVFYDLTVNGRPHAEDAKVLQADWLQDSIVLCVTPEIYNEIHRSPNEDEKRRCRTSAQAFRELKTDDAKVRALEMELAPLFNGATLERDISDTRQVAHAIAAEVPFFVTRDAPMLGRNDPIFDRYGLRILHPTDLVNRFDMLRREAEYRPIRLEGSSWRARLVVSDDVRAIVAAFKHRSRERSGNFEQRVRHYLANPGKWASTIIADTSSCPTAFLVRSITPSSHVEVPLLRHADHPLAGTLLRHLIHEISRESCADGQKVIIVNDSELSDEAKTALTELGFLPDENAWWKMSITGFVSKEKLISIVRDANIPPALKERLVGAVFVSPNDHDVASASRLENLFSPAKLEFCDAPCYIISIRQSWAAHFFDIPVGGQTLMDLNEKLHLGIEGAYYCSGQNTYVDAPGRVLWYVSGRGSMSIKACSHLDEKIIGTPKELYTRLRHLGVYAWKHVLETANGKPDHSLIAFRFSRTERFVRPIALAALKELGIAQPQNPRRITAKQFAVIYKCGMKLC